jgi:hypothetical protein
LAAPITSVFLAPRAWPQRYITADGKAIYFTAVRTAGATRDVYTSTWNGSAWSMPVRDDQLSSDTEDENDVAVSPDQLTAMIVRLATDGTRTLMIARRATKAERFAAPVALPPLAFHTGADPAAPSITNNGDAIYLHANSPGGGMRDLYYVKRIGDPLVYSTPAPLAQLNTTGRDSAPFISGDDLHVRPRERAVPDIALAGSSSSHSARSSLRFFGASGRSPTLRLRSARASCASRTRSRS